MFPMSGTLKPGRGIHNSCLASVRDRRRTRSCRYIWPQDPGNRQGSSSIGVPTWGFEENDILSCQREFKWVHKEDKMLPQRRHAKPDRPTWTLSTIPVTSPTME